MAKYIDWTRLYEKYAGQWVALDEDNETVVASGDTAEAALQEAISRGCKHAALTFVPTEVITFAGAYEV